MGKISYFILLLHLKIVFYHYYIVIAISFMIDFKLNGYSKYFSLILGYN